MADISVSYLGLKLKNPVIAASSGLTATETGVKKAIDAGAAAVVLKSLFEEQLRAELKTTRDAHIDHPEVDNYLNGMGMNEGSGDYLKLIESARKDGRAIVIASVNCSGSSFWVDFAKRIESAGADALELNIGNLPVDPNETGKEIEDAEVKLVTAVCKAVKLPVSVKIGSSFTNPGNICMRFAKAGAKAAVLFNRFYRMDIDLDKMSMKAGPTRSSPEAYHESLRWISLLDGRTGLELAASGGIYDGQTALKLIAAGANAVQICSAMYSSGYDVLGTILKDIEHWMDSRNIASLSEFKSRLARRNSMHPEEYGRLHYIKALTGQH